MGVAAMAYLRISNLGFTYPRTGLNADSQARLRVDNRIDGCGDGLRDDGVRSKEACDKLRSMPSAGDVVHEISVALKGISFEVERRDIVLLAGKSGSGKTTLLKMLKPMIAPKGRMEGTILLEGCKLDSLPEIEQARRIGFVMQDPDAQICTDMVISELAFGLENEGVPFDEMHARIAEAVMYFGMTDILHTETSKLSGGQKQLLNLASVFVMRPEVILLDEPMAQLDPVSRRRFLDMLLQINEEFGTTIVIAEHYLDDLYRHADKVVFLKTGRLVCEGDPRAAARKIYDAHDGLLELLPASARMAKAIDPDTSFIPLTVREARAWLEDRADIDQGHSRSHSVAEEDPTSAPAIALRDIRFRYDRNLPDILRACTFSVHPGEVYALFGANGSGKTTLLKMLTGALKPYMGSIRLNGNKVRAEQLRASHAVAYIPQDPTLLFSKNTVAQEVANLAHLDRVGLAACADQHPFDLSGGQRQLLAFAKMLDLDALIVCMDEPTKGMDAATRGIAEDIINQIASQGRAVVLATHDVELACSCASRCAMLFDGDITTVQPAHQFFEDNFIYTTAVKRMGEGIVSGAVTIEEMVQACQVR